MLAAVYKEHSNMELARMFGTTVKSVENKLARMREADKLDWHEWTVQEDELLESLYKDMTNYELAQKFHLRIGQIESRLRRLGLVRYEETVKKATSTRPPARYSNPDYSSIDRYYQKERQSYYAQ